MNSNHNIWFTSDTHYGHGNILMYSARPFGTAAEQAEIAEIAKLQRNQVTLEIRQRLQALQARIIPLMDEAMIVNWNAVVKPGDTVYHLGDVSFWDAEKTHKLLSRLVGNKVLIYGNHDKMIKKSHDLKRLFGWIADYTELSIDDPTSKGGNRKVVLSHFPMITWNKAHHGSLMLHGHCHGNLRYPFKARIMDMGVDPQGFVPVSAAEVLSRLRDVTPDEVDHHRGD